VDLFSGLFRFVAADSKRQFAPICHAVAPSDLRAIYQQNYHHQVLIIVELIFFEGLMFI